MELKIGNCRILKIDEMNVALEQYKLVPQSKNPNFRHDGDKYDWMHIGYYPNILSALKKLVDKELLESESDDADNLIKKIEELHDKVDKIQVIATELV